MHENITIGGWFFLVIAWACIIGLNVFCFSKILGDTKDEIVDPLPTLDREDV